MARVRQASLAILITAVLAVVTTGTSFTPGRTIVR